MSRRYAITIVADRPMLPPATFLASRLVAMNNRNDTDIIVYSDWPEGIEEARRVATGVQFREVDFKENLKTYFTPSARFPAATYFRLSIPHLLKDEYAKILYVDVDTYPVSDALFDLFGLELGDAPLAASRAISAALRKGYSAGKQGDRVLNSGLLLIERDTYLRKNVEGRCTDMLRERRSPPPGADQDIFNEVLDGDWLELSPRFNLNFKFAFSEIAEAFPPVLLHFIGTYKSWDTPTAARNHPARLELEAFLAATAWRHFVARRRFTPNALKHYLRSAGRQLGLTVKQREQISPLPETGLDLHRLADYLVNTDFVDVVQNLSEPNPAGLEKVRNLGAVTT